MEASAEAVKPTNVAATYSFKTAFDKKGNLIGTFQELPENYKPSPIDSIRLPDDEYE